MYDKDLNWDGGRGNKEANTKPSQRLPSHTQSSMKWQVKEKGGAKVFWPG